jgi:hypothetical protein
VSHRQYIDHVSVFVADSLNNPLFSKLLDIHAREFLILMDLDLDPASQTVHKLYCPVKRAPYRDPLAMLRSLILMTLRKVRSITQWVEILRTNLLFAVMAGFDPHDTPGVGTYYDFFHRLIDGPYRRPCEHLPRKSLEVRCLHERNLKKEKEAREEARDHSSSLSEKLVNELLPLADQPRHGEFPTVLQDLLAQVGIRSSIRKGLLQEGKNLVLAGDGSILESAASPRGKPSCTCSDRSSCGHNRLYSSATAAWCYDAYRDCYIFGDRYYHLVAPVGGHDLPLITIMPGGNESDYTLSLKAFDQALKVLREHQFGLHPAFFCGDGHHDTHAHYRYFQAKGIVPIIPLSELSKVVLHLASNPQIQLTPEGFPLCPAGKLLRHHAFNKERNLHVFCCPAKRNTHRFGKSLYVFHPEDCPRRCDCFPRSPLGPLVYIRSEENPRLFPPVPRNTELFKNIMNMRSATERCNAVIDWFQIEGAHRCAAYGLIRLTLANICQHAIAQHAERLKACTGLTRGESAEKTLLDQTLRNICSFHREQYLDTG